MLVVFSPIFVADTKIIFRDYFVAPLIKSILNKPESVNRHQHTLCYCKFVSQNENIDTPVRISAPKVGLTGTGKSSSFKERQLDKYKKEIKEMQNVQDTSDENENKSAEATLGSDQQ